LSDNPIAALSSLIIAISPLINVLLKMHSMLRYAYELSFLNEWLHSHDGMLDIEI
jgi:hypothetical protein